MFGKSDLIDSLSRDLARARNKRDALASDVTTLTAQIAELEARLSAERDRRGRERAVSEMEGIKKRVRDEYLAFAPAIAGIRGATEMAAAIVPEGHAFNDLLPVIATEVANSIDGLLGDLDRRIELLARATPHRSCHSPSMGLPSCRKIVIAYSVFQNGCLAGSRGKKNQLKIGAAQQRRECRLGKLLADITPCRLVLNGNTGRSAPHIVRMPLLIGLSNALGSLNMRRLMAL